MVLGCEIVIFCYKWDTSRFSKMLAKDVGNALLLASKAK